MAMRRDRAEIVALGALGWLAEAELMDAFLDATGADREVVRRAAGDAEFLGSVLDFLLQDDAWVRGACRAQGVPPETLLEARAALPGGDLPHWT
jgi:hypothetical protein